MKTIPEALEAFLLSASFPWTWDKSHLETSPWSEAMSGALDQILGHRGFFKFYFILLLKIQI